MKRINFVITKSRSLRGLLSMRPINQDGQPMQYGDLQGLITAAGFAEGERVMLVPVPPSKESEGQ